MRGGGSNRAGDGGGHTLPDHGCREAPGVDVSRQTETAWYEKGQVEARGRGSNKSFELFHNFVIISIKKCHFMNQKYIKWHYWPESISKDYKLIISIIIIITIIYSGDRSAKFS